MRIECTFNSLKRAHVNSPLALLQLNYIVLHTNIVFIFSLSLSYSGTYKAHVLLKALDCLKDWTGSQMN